MPLGLGFNLQLDQPYGGSTFVPTSLSGCVLWLPPVAGLDGYMYTDSGGAIEVTLDGQVVGRWEDASGSGNAATQSTAANKPLYKTGIQNSLPMVLFDGSNDYILCNSLAATFSGTDQPYTIAITHKNAVIGTSQSLLGTGRNGFANPLQEHYTRNTNVYNLGRRDDGGTYVSTTGGTVDTSCKIWLIRHNGTTIDSWVNSTQIITGAAFDVGAMTLDRCAIGANIFSGTPSTYYNGYIGEVVAWNRALTNTECSNVRTWAISKWAL